MVMLSFLSTRAGASVLLKYARISEISATFASSSCYTKNKNESSRTEPPKPVEQSGQSHPHYKRDLINFPRPKRLDTNPPVRFGFVPKSWFDFFYPKTGVTGGYMFLFSVMVTLLSKEIIVLSEHMIDAYGYVTLVVVIHKFYGQKIYNYIEKQLEEDEQLINSHQEQQKQYYRDYIKELEKNLWCDEGVSTFLPEAKRENVYLQMEIEYRKRLAAQYMAVKNCLDYQVEKFRIEREAFQKNLFMWVVNQIYESITPEIKENALRKSIEDLRELASTSAV